MHACKKYLTRLTLVVWVLLYGLASNAFSAELTSHPRLWLSAADVPRLRSWAVESNPLYSQGIQLAAVRAKEAMDRGDVPQRDCGTTNYEEYPTEMYAELFAFMSLIENDATVRADYANRARSLLMHVINLAALGPSSQQNVVCAASGTTGYPPFRSPIFFTEDSNRARYHGEAFPLVVDWIYPVLSAQDKASIRTVFLRWSQEIIDSGYHHPSPVGMVDNSALLADKSQVRWSGNNYFTAHMRNLGLMALALDPADDSGGQLRAYLGNATGAWLYIFDHLTRTDSRGGLLPEGFEYSPQTASYAIQFLLALRTAGADTCGSHCLVAGNPFWDDFVTAYYHSLSPATVNDANVGQLYEAAWYGSAQTYHMGDFISAFGALGAYDTLAGNSARLQSLRWAETHTAPGGSVRFLNRVSNPDDFRNALLYFMLYDPTVAAAADPRAALAPAYFAPGLNKIFSRTSWETNASWFNFSLSWNFVDHQQADGNSFEWYRKGEWLTKARTGYPDIAEGIASSEFRNTLALENNKPNRDATDWRTDLWARGSQWNLVATGDPTLLARSEHALYTYALGDATNQYNSTSENVTDIVHASRSIVWLKPDTVIVYDRGQSATSNRFKRWWLQLAQPASISGNTASSRTAAGQQLKLTSLQPSGAVLSAVNSTDAHTESTASANDVMKVRLRVDAPGNPVDVRFLQVLQAADAAGTFPEATLVQSSDLAWSGVQVDTSVVLFPVTLPANPANPAPLGAFTYTASSAVTRHIITGLQVGQGYTVTSTGSGASRLVAVSAGGSTVADSGGVLVFTPGTNANIPVCTLTASPLVIAAGSAATLTASCNPGVTTYTWTGGSCAGTTGASCTVTPTITTSYSVTGTNTNGTSAAASATVTVNAIATAPVCTLSANPVSVPAGGSSTLTASCSPAASSYIWTGGSCAGTSVATCTVTPTSTTTYSVTGVNAAGTSQAASATVSVVAANPTSYTVPGTLGNDVFVLTAGNSYYGGGGNDTFIISHNTLRGDVTAKIVDSEGDNLIQLVDGMTVTASTFYSDAAQLTLSTGARVQILGASKFKFQLGANALAGDTAAVVTYGQFVSSLGASLSGALPASGTAGYVVPTGFTQASLPVPAVAGNASTVPGTLGDDVLVPSGGNNHLGGGGNDTYIISPYTLSGTVTAKIIDTEGSNVVQLVNGMAIASSSFFNNAVQLTLSNGATVQILGASGFGYQLGANAPAGEMVTSLSYAQFAATLGASIPAAGAAAVSGSANFVVNSLRSTNSSGR